MIGLVSCQTPQSTLNPGGPAAGKISTLEWTVLILFCIVGVIMCGLLLWVAVRKRGSLDWHERWDIGGGQSWITIGGFAIPFVILSFVFVYGLADMRAFPIYDGSVKPQIKVIGHQWWWEIHYIGGPVQRQFITANEIHIPVGRPVDIELDTGDVIHSFWVPTLHGKVDLIPKQPNYIRIQADHEGTFHGQCAEYCGEEHARMMIIVVAQKPQDYQAWLDQQLQPAAAPASEEAIHGQDVFMSAACIMCHSVRGTPAQGHVAPDLTHLASRQGIAANTYPNDEADLEAWVTHAQSLKPGSLMPDLTQFNGTDLRALVAYLRGLR
jgi:cytochrome c oxidase subunit 2